MGRSTVERAINTETDTITAEKKGADKLGWFMSKINRNIPTRDSEHAGIV